MHPKASRGDGPSPMGPADAALFGLPDLTALEAERRMWALGQLGYSPGEARRRALEQLTPRLAPQRWRRG